ncbi:hypothetical protein BH10BAC5_BH10BAC5_20350 [soil metagenome]
MKKFICLAVFFTAVLTYSANAQSLNNQSGLKKEVQNKVNTYLTQNPKASLEDLKATMVDEYGIKDMKLMKLNNGNYVKVDNMKSVEKKPGEIAELDTYTIVIILAVIGAIAVILLIFK